MNGETRKIEILKPFEDALELTKKILFQPFDFEKWLTIGFAAFLTYLNGGGFGGFRFPVNSNWPNNTSFHPGDIRSWIDQMGPIWWSLIAFAILLGLAIFLVLMWVRTRGRFIFIDCIVRNRGAIVQPWKDYQPEGNSYFIFSLWLFALVFAVIIIVALMVVVPMLIIQHYEHGALMFLPLALSVIILPLFLLLTALVQFVAPVMYRRRCKSWPAFKDLVSLLGKYPGVFILYLLFGFVVGIAVAIIIVAGTCLTCCIAAIPYIGTVIFLPVYVFMQSFSLLFIRQFGSDYDVWASVPPPPSVQPPPLPS